ncbi:carbon-nitrogen hydrolase family protein [Aneurinibacillus terranovensis]|uniref:carbon-nitrogen hydrolase family protein n=1 Tax=Aneurinibacillus terranovensis TaxID=278991 RepID=UPI0003FD22D9|nr:carbon-nitrogen hydrolase family protein [Aneurinibacillus terranovensis]
MDKVLRVAAAQMNCTLGDKEANIRNASKLIEQAVVQGAKLVVLPELFNTGYRVEEQDMQLSEAIPGPTTDWLCAMSRKHQIYTVSCILEKPSIEGVVFDTAILTGPQGIIGTYRKIHLWDQENTRFGKGKAFPVFDLGFVRIGLQICYEVGFPEGARILTLRGADLVIYPSAFGKARLYAWDIATRSRALENGTYVIACNRSGVERGETVFGGSSRIVNPQGEVLVEASREDEVILADLDLSLISKQRQTIPYLRDLNRALIKEQLANV